MSQAAARPKNLRRFPHDCPTCDSPAGRGCVVIDVSLDRYTQRSISVAEHAARKRLRKESS
jgi:hypothetical protein